jgi:hypothetical protein
MEAMHASQRVDVCFTAAQFNLYALPVLSKRGIAACEIPSFQTGSLGKYNRLAL